MIHKVLFLLAFMVAGAAQAKPACRLDAARFCPHLDFDSVSRCLLTNEAKLSKGCAKQLNEGQNTDPQCVEHREKLCPGEIIGTGLGVCMLKHEKELSPYCQ